MRQSNGLRSGLLTLAITMLWGISLPALGQTGRTEGDLVSPSEIAGIKDKAVGANCLGQGQAKTYIHNALVGQINLLGLYLQTDLRWCFPIKASDNILWLLSNVQVGLTTFTSPTNAFVGVFATIAPISLLEFGARAFFVNQWPFLPGTGFIANTQGGGNAYSLEWAWDYVDRVAGMNEIDVSHAAYGYRADWWATLQGLVPIVPGRFHILAQVSATWEMWYMRSFYDEYAKDTYNGEDYDFYYNGWADMWLHTRDGMFRIDAVVLADHIFKGEDTNFHFRWGGQFQHRWAFLKAESGAVNMLSGLLLGVSMDSWGPARDLSMLIRVAGWIRHPGFDNLGEDGGPVTGINRINLAIVLSTRWDLEWFSSPKSER